MGSVHYLDQIIQILTRIQKEDGDLLQKAADWIFETIQAEKCVYFYGCTHAGILTQEAFYRTGGLAIFNPIFAPGTLVSDQPITLTSSVERLDGYGKILVHQHGIEKGDLLFIHSVSGRNCIPVDMAVTAREKGARVVAITSIDYTKNVMSRHSSGKNLYQCCDLVIDNHCPYGDALIELHGGQKVGPGSTSVGVSILNEIVVRTAERFDQEGVVPPVFSSANVDHGDLRNMEVYKLYKKNIRYKMV